MHDYNKRISPLQVLSILNIYNKQGCFLVLLYGSPILFHADGSKLPICKHFISQKYAFCAGAEKAFQTIFIEMPASFEDRSPQHDIQSWPTLLRDVLQQQRARLGSMYTLVLEQGIQDWIKISQATVYAVTILDQDQFRSLCEKFVWKSFTHYKLVASMMMLLHPHSFLVVWSMTLYTQQELSQDNLWEILLAKFTMLDKALLSAVGSK